MTEERIGQLGLQPILLGYKTDFTYVSDASAGADKGLTVSGKKHLLGVVSLLCGLGRLVGM